MYKKILVPLDGSSQSLGASKHALELARLMEAEVLLYHVTPTLPQYVSTFGDGLNDAYCMISDEISESGEEILKNAREEFVQYGIKARTKVIWGNPAMEICREAREGRYDLIVMSSRGLGEIKGYLMGSVSNRVVRHAGCPVLIVR